jgi:hypothetical protein
VTVRLSGGEHAALDGAAQSLGVETGGLLKAAAMLGLAGAVAEVEAGRLRVRRRSSPRAGSGFATSDEVPKSEPGVSGGGAVDRAVAARRAAGVL